MKLGIVGCGFIGSTLAYTAADMDEVDEVLLLDTKTDRVAQISNATPKARGVEGLDEMLASADLVVEAANQAFVAEHGREVVGAGRHLMIMSVGALVDDELWEDLKARARENDRSVFIPTGALGGADLLKAASRARLDDVLLVTTKPPKALSGAPLVTQDGIDLMALRKPRTLFEGTARDAVGHFPQNINVAALVALAGVGFDRTRVRIVVDPGITRNKHELFVEGRFGKMRCSILNAPSTSNPRTSYLSALSAISTLENVVRGVWIGA